MEIKKCEIIRRVEIVKDKEERHTAIEWRNSKHR